MNRHPYLRAYLAGIAVPTIGTLIALTVFIVARLVYNVPVAIERLLVFPMAVVPNIWGVWNMLYIRLGSRYPIPLGIHGAALLILLVPAGIKIATSLNIGIVTPIPAWLITVLPVAAAVYYLVWKHIVGFLNRLLGSA